MRYQEWKTKKLLLEAKKIFADACAYEEYELLGCCRLIKDVCKEQQNNLQKQIKVSDIQEMLKTLNERAYNILRWKYWEKYTARIIAKMLGISGERVRQLKMKALARFKIFIVKLESVDQSTPIEALGINSRGYWALKRAGINYIDELAKLSQKDLLNIKGVGPNTVEEVKLKLTDFMMTIVPKGRIKFEDLPIDVLKFANRFCNALKRAGVFNIQQLLSMSAEEIYCLKGIGKKGIQQIIQKKNEMMDKCNDGVCQGADLSLDSVNLSVRALRCVQALNVQTVEEFVNLTKEEVVQVRQIGEKTWHEICEKQQQLKYGKY